MGRLTDDHSRLGRVSSLASGYEQPIRGNFERLMMSSFFVYILDRKLRGKSSRGCSMHIGEQPVDGRSIVHLLLLVARGKSCTSIYHSCERYSALLGQKFGRLTMILLYVSLSLALET